MKVIKQIVLQVSSLVAGFKYFLFPPPFGEDEPSLANSFANGWFNHQPDQDVEKGMIKFPPFL